MNRNLKEILICLGAILINLACWYFSNRTVKVFGLQINLLTAIFIAILMIEPIIGYIKNPKPDNPKK